MNKLWMTKMNGLWWAVVLILSVFSVLGYYVNATRKVIEVGDSVYFSDMGTSSALGTVLAKSNNGIVIRDCEGNRRQFSNDRFVVPATEKCPS